MELEIVEEFDEKLQKNFYVLYKKRMLFWHYVLLDSDLYYVEQKAEKIMANGNKKIHNKIVKQYKG
ncbi:hypothetical protein EBZ38_07650 [bacterium]|nr:hypothetical protein [bacterium]